MFQPVNPIIAIVRVSDGSGNPFLKGLAGATAKGKSLLKKIAADSAVAAPQKAISFWGADERPQKLPEAKGRTERS